jgi:2-polyprenyl-3-methyl-5-hydroxy-6-metoxy-1,4-benzoquinol methylase
MERNTFPIASGFSIRFAPPDFPDQLIVPKDQELSESFYETFYRSNEVDSLRIIRHWQAETLLDRLVDLDFKGKRVLEIGCGNGDFLRHLAARHPDALLTGIDPHTAHPSNQIRKMSLEEFLIAWRGQHLPPYDVIIMLDVFEHMPDPVDTLRKVRSLLGPSGRLILKVPNKNSILYRVGKCLTQVRISLGRQILSRIYQVHYFPPHYYYYNKSSLSELLAGENWEVDSIHYVSELPAKLVWKRMWGFSLAVKCLLYPMGLIYSLISIGSLQDGMLMVTRSKT